VRVDPPLVLAPLAGTTTPPFRLLCRRAGAGLVCSEMVSALGLRYDNRKTEELLLVWPQEQPVSVQLFGREPDVLAAATQQAIAAGAAVVDLNLGCAVPKVRKAGAGVQLLREPRLAAEVVAAMVRAAGAAPVTAKLRAGWHPGDDSYLDLGRRLEQAGAAGLALHARTVVQGFRGPADWGAIARLKEAVSCPVLGNGDVRTGQDVQRMLQVTGCDGVMVGRASMGNPAVFAEIATVLRGESPARSGASDRLALALCQAQMLCRLKGEQRAIREMRGQATWYIRGLPGAARWRASVQQVKSLAELQEVLVSSARAAQEQEAEQAPALGT
jgi:nifR3 family TIM-barrel protein